MKITPLNNGPIVIEGDFSITDPAGREYNLQGRKKISLCRCGASNNKPFCDGSHRGAAFDSACEAFELPPPKQATS